MVELSSGGGGSRDSERRTGYQGTRVPVGAIVDNAEFGLSVTEISEQFPVSPDQVQAILRYAKGHRIEDPVR